ncbi:nucleotidyltransferase domain-containing protein [Bacillus sp. FJAT-28004]|uniref:nucleotidyltransferase domain-containing protein n=1 Tax=Bacillus sp. FJAT-28004 TaxID=1679165 RepID=UPI0039C9D48E
MEKCIEVNKIMNKFRMPWAIAGGWSIDLYLGKVTRDHSDIEIAILRDHQLAIREYLTGWDYKKVQGGKIITWSENEILELPIHETYAEKVTEKIEILLNESDNDWWIYRRDSRIQREMQKTILITANGIPYLSPEITLLFKSKNPEPKDEKDFKNIVNYLDGEQKAWLQTSLKLVYTEHPWIESLS